MKGKLYTYTVILHLCFLPSLTASATEYFATPDFGDDSAKDCLTEATAGSLTNAMARAKADSDVVTLLPGEGGVYDMTAFTAKSGVYFAISKKITVRSKAEDPATVTLLGGGSANPARLFTFPNTSASLRGVTVTNFYSSSSTVGLVYKGLVSNCVFAANTTKGRVGTCVNDSLCDDCVFSDNVCNNSGTHWTGGGAGSGGTYLNCRFFRNQAVTSAHQSNGGALYLPSFVSNCVFVGNYATQRGGAIGTAQNASYTIRVVDSFFTNNLAGSGGGAVYGVTVSNCVISSSAGRCTDGAGAQYVKAYDTVFADNICSNYTHYHGGGAAAYGYYYHCRFERNKVVKPDGHQSFGGAILQPTLVSNCVFISNYCADRGGAIGSEGSSANYNSVIMESYFTNNTSGASAGGDLRGDDVRLHRLRQPGKGLVRRRRGLRAGDELPVHRQFHREQFVQLGRRRRRAGLRLGAQLRVPGQQRPQFDFSGRGLGVLQRGDDELPRLRERVQERIELLRGRRRGVGGDGAVRQLHDRLELLQVDERDRRGGGQVRELHHPRERAERRLFAFEFGCGDADELHLRDGRLGHDARHERVCPGGGQDGGEVPLVGYDRTQCLLALQFIASEESRL